MKAQTNLFHPNTSLIFCEDYLLIRVSLNINKDLAPYFLMTKYNHNVVKGKYRMVFALTYSTKNYSKENIIRIQSFLLSRAMSIIRQAKIIKLRDEEEKLNKRTNDLLTRIK